MPNDTPLAKGAIPLRERRTLADEWRELEELVVPKDAPTVQRVEMKRSFYAGAAAMSSLVICGLDNDSEPTELDLQYMDSLLDEVQEFASKIGEDEE